MTSSWSYYIHLPLSQTFVLISYATLHFLLRGLLWASNELRATDFVILQSLQTIRDTRESVRQNFDVVRLEADAIIMQEQNGGRHVP